MVKKLLPILISIGFAFIAGLPLLHRGLLPTHDGEYHIVRFYEFDKAIHFGFWYPRWASDLNNGFGVPLFNYVYPLPNFVSSFFHLFGASFIDAFKLQMFSAGIIGAIFFYLWSKEFWGELGGLVSSVFYTFAPYHFVDIYVRGSVGEVWALALFPAFLWSITKAFSAKKSRFLSLSSILLALIIFSHNILALMFLPFSLSYAGLLMVLGKNKRVLLFKVLFTFILGIGLASIFWVPALLEKSYVHGLEVFSIANNFPELYQLLFPSWGSGFSQDLANGLSFQIGPLHLLSVFFGAAIVLAFYKKNWEKSSILLFFLGWFFLIFFLMLRFSLVVWQKIPLMNFFQFPWRFLSLEILIASFLAGSFLSLKKSRIMTAIMIVLVFILGISYTQPAYYLYRNDSYYTTQSNFIDGTNSVGNAFNTVWFNTPLKRTNQKLVLQDSQVYITSQEGTQFKYSATVNTNMATNVKLNVEYFPSWSLHIDGKKETIIPSKEGLAQFVIPKGQHKVLILMEETVIEQVAKYISLFSLLVLLSITKRFVTIKK